MTHLSSVWHMLMTLSWIALPLTILVLVPMAFVPRTRATAGTGLFATSFLFGITTWLLGAAVTFTAFGFVGLLGGLLLLGIGVVPLALIAAFFIWHASGLGCTVAVMSIVTLVARVSGGRLMAAEPAAD
ncbi:MAG TPA: hypothetical protein VFW98_17470 [Gemmatimonadaceae bacterium]|nr:hypothetical protein [Gemmatimonadaceae bacterium]